MKNMKFREKRGLFIILLFTAALMPSKAQANSISSLIFRQVVAVMPLVTKAPESAFGPVNAVLQGDPPPVATVQSAAAQSQPAQETAAQEEESIFVKMLADPYIKRHGRPPGEGWIPLPGTRTEVRFGGFIQLSVLHDFQNAGFPYAWFVPALIPVPTDDTPNTQFDVRASRVAFETRTNTEDVGSVRTTFEIDFYGNLTDPLRDTFPSPRLRQAYVTWVGPKSHISFTVGQAWSTFVDLETWPWILDMQGPNAMTGARQGMLRGSYAFGEKKDLIFDLSIEQPNTLVQNGLGLRKLPDLATRLNWRRDWGHFQVAGLARQLVGESAEGTGRDSAFGYGLSFSGSINVPGTRRKNVPDDNIGPRQDTIQFQIQGGSGLGRYVNDLTTTLSAEDAVYDQAAKRLEPIPAIGAFAAYHHWWTERLCSVLMYSVVDVNNLDLEAPNAQDRTTFVLVNLAYRLFNRMDLCLEYVWGERRNKDGEKAHANRIQFGLNFGF